MDTKIDVAQLVRENEELRATNIWLRSELYKTQNALMSEESQLRDLRIQYRIVALQLVNSTRGII